MKMKNLLAESFSAVLMFIIGLATAGLFLSGTTLNFWGLSLLPEIVHTAVGWILVVLTFLAGWFNLKKLTK